MFKKGFFFQNYFKASVIGTTIMTLFNNLAYKIDDVDENKNPSSEFVRKDGSKISYIDYYKQVCFFLFIDF